MWCTDEGCAGEAYQQALHVVWKLLICFTLFFGANFLKCGLARLLSYQFYRTAHFMKVKEAIERVSCCLQQGMAPHVRSASTGLDLQALLCTSDRMQATMSCLQPS